MNNIMDMSAEVREAKSRFGIVGNAPALVAAVQRALRVAPIDLSVLITGESGTGKEFFPQIIHAYGARKHSKYIAVNCGAIPEGTMTPSCSVMKKVRLPVLSLPVKVISRKPTEAPSFLTRLPSCR